MMRKKILLVAVCLALGAANTFPAAAQGLKRGRTARKRSAFQSATVTLGEAGYQPSRLKLRRGVPARLTFVRKIEETCGKEIAIPDYNIRRALPLNEPVTVEFTPTRAGEFNFTCGMGMLRGTVIVR